MTTRILKNISFAFVIVIFIFGIVTIDIKGATLSDPNDILTVVSPSPNSIVKDSINVSIRAYDDDQKFIEAQINLYDPNTCNSINHGSITSITSLLSNKSNSSIISWDTRSTQLTSKLADGNYCLKICTVMQFDQTPYSACNSRIISVVNDNSPPKITSIPPKVKFFEGEKFQYQILALDPDGDPLKYRFVTTANFLNIDQNSGLVSSTELSTLGQPGLSYNITIAVSDGINAEVPQSFQLEIYKKPESPPLDPPKKEEPPKTNSGRPKAPSEEKTDEQPFDDSLKDFIFEVPNEETVFTDESNLIRWKLADQNIKSLKLEYSTDQENWTQIGDTFAPTRTYYLWDVSGLEDGEYYLRSVVEKPDGQILYKISEKFEVRLTLSNNPETIKSEPLISNVKPEKDSKITEKKPTLSGDFIASEEQSILSETFSISLNGSSINELCSVSKDNFLCELDEELDIGAHVVSTSVVDSSDQKAELEWSFEIIEEASLTNEVENNSEDNNQEAVNILGREVPRSGLILIGVILCLGAILLFIPWILFSIWSGRDRNEKLVEGDSFDNINDLPPLSNDTPSSIPNYDTNQNFNDSDFTYNPELTNISSSNNDEEFIEPTQSS